MKKLLVVVFSVIFLMSFAIAADWTGGNPFPDTTGGIHVKSASGHGMAVSPDGKVWFMSYFVADTVICDDGHDGDQDTINVRSVIVWNADGTLAPFSPIKKIKYPDGSEDTLRWSGVGMRADHDGNVVICNYESARRVNYLTGEGINKCEPISTDENAGISPGFDSDNNMFIGTVFPSLPTKAYDSDFAIIGDLFTPAGYSRCMTVSADAKDVYRAAYSMNLIEIFHSDDGLDGIYASADTIKNFCCTAMDWNPATGNLWLGEWGTIGDKRAGCFYAYDVATKTFVDSILVDFTGKTATGGTTRPGAIAFSPDGNTAYVTFYASELVPIDGVYKYSKSDGVWKETGKFVTGYNLDQNYPNPFNATTVIPYSITKSGNVKLTVFDLLGHEVKTLVSEKMEAGDYTYKLDASGLATGMYIYRLEVNGVNISKRMMYVK